MARFTLRQWVLIAALLISQTALAQSGSLPDLKDDKAISIGTLPNGVTFYFADNKSHKGMRSFRLVQKVTESVTEDELYSAARKRFTDVLYGEVTLDNFMGRNGILPTENGYISCRKGAIEYTFDNLSSAREDSVLDTVLLSVFNLAQQASLQGIPSSAQAIIVAGDFDRNVMLSKLKVLCLLNPYVAGDAPVYEYVWNKPEDGESKIRTEGGAISKVSVRWRGARTPDNYMKTILPVVSGKMAGELGNILRSRLVPVFREKGYDVWMDYERHCSDDCCGDETIALTVSCRGSIRKKVKDVLAKELDRLYTYGVSQEEYRLAYESFRFSWTEKSAGAADNLTYLGRCASHFLYGSSLANDAERLANVYKSLPDSTQTLHFNRYLRGLLAQSSVMDPSLEKYDAVSAMNSVRTALDKQVVKSAAKMPKDKSEYVTGGIIWTFPNGINVIYREQDTKGLTYFAYASKGGRQHADYSRLSSIDGVEQEEFSRILSSLGIRYDVEMHPTDVCLRGCSYTESLPDVLKLLSAISNRKGNEAVFGGNCYKVLVITGDYEVAALKKLLCSHILPLGSGGNWISGKYVEETDGHLRDLRRFIWCERTFNYDITVYNYAVSIVAGYALADRLACSFSGYGEYCLLRDGFVGRPLNRYRILYGIRHLPLKHFSTLRARLGEDTAQQAIDSVIASLSREKIPEKQLKAYRTMAKNRSDSYNALPWACVDKALDRYLNNKDMASHISAQTGAVTSESVQNFYAAASASNR